jgi:hypothetical protein
MSLSNDNSREPDATIEDIYMALHSDLDFWQSCSYPQAMAATTAHLHPKLTLPFSAAVAQYELCH